MRRARVRCRVAALLLLPALAFAQAAPEQPPAEAAPAFPSASFRLGVGVAPIVGFSGRSYFLNKLHLLPQGGWVNIDAAPGLHVSRFFTLELAVSVLVPVQDAWGFPPPAWRSHPRCASTRAGSTRAPRCSSCSATA